MTDSRFATFLDTFHPDPKTRGTQWEHVCKWFKDVDHVAVLVLGTPQILLPPLDLDEHLVQMPGVAHLASAARNRRA